MKIVCVFGRHSCKLPHTGMQGTHTHTHTPLLLFCVCICCCNGSISLLGVFKSALHASLNIHTYVINSTHVHGMEVTAHIDLYNSAACDSMIKVSIQRKSVKVTHIRTYNYKSCTGCIITVVHVDSATHTHTLAHNTELHWDLNNVQSR